MAQRNELGRSCQAVLTGLEALKEPRLAAV